MANDGQIVFEITADGKHAIADIKDVTRQIQQETKKWDNAAKESTDNIGGGFSSMLKKIGGAITAAAIGKKLIQIGKDAIQAASDLAEVQNVVDVTFGDSANQIDKWAKDAIHQFGLTETQAKRFASTMGAMMKSSGLAGDEIVGMSENLAGLAADMASFYNMDFDSAFQKIRSGISGETEPLKQLGINMSVANLNAYALQKGLSKTFEQMSQGEQVMLRYQYIMSATADAQGDFARTSDEYANSQRLLESNIDSLKSKLGGFVTDTLAKATTALNEFIDLLTKEQPKTVLDDFEAIDQSTERKLAQIRSTAEEANSLVGVLDQIGGEKTSKAGGKVQQLVNDLSTIDFSQGKPELIKEFIKTLGDNIEIISSIQGTDADGAKAWLENIATGAEKLTPDDTEGWANLLKTIKDGLPGIENTEFGKSFFTALGENVTSATQEISLYEWVIDNLGDKTDRTADEQRIWLETCKRLTQVIPGLSNIINAETGEIEGGTEAVREYIKAWQEGQTKLALMSAHEAKKTALDKKFAELPGLELDYRVAAYKFKKEWDKVKDIYKKYGLNLATNENGTVNTLDWDRVTGEDRKALEEFSKAVNDTGLAKGLHDTQSELARQREAYKEAEEALKLEAEMLDELPGDTKDALNEANNYWEEHADEVKEKVNTAAEAIKNLDDYVQEYKNNVAKAVDSVVHGFGEIETPMMKAAKRSAEITKELGELDSSAEDAQETINSLNAEMSKIKSDKISAQNMGKGLEQQAEYMDKYLEYLRTARTLGFSDEVLAALADGSEESYDYLEALSHASKGEIDTINANYQAVIDKKKQLSDELTAQQLKVDDTYLSLAEKAKEAVQSLDMEELAAENTGKTVKGLAQGIASHVSEVQEAVDAVCAQLDRLTGLGISIDLGQFGTVHLSSGTGGSKINHDEQRSNDVIPAFAAGTDWIPYDNFLARLHEGEAVLTAEENKVWQMMKNGSLSGVDYDSLGGVMRDNIKPGGNVYLDGKMVGAVVSDRQGRSFKSLQRSGWQQ